MFVLTPEAGKTNCPKGQMDDDVGLDRAASPQAAV
jgi:hypothetical protein